MVKERVRVKRLLLGITCALYALPPGAVAATISEPPPPPPPPSLSCQWDGRAFSNGAQFCVTTGASLKCNAGNWDTVTSGGIACDRALPLQPGVPFQPGVR
jgi:hypothetical protein